MNLVSLNLPIVFCILVIYLVYHVRCALKFEYHSNEELEAILKDFEQLGKKKLTTRLYQIGNSSSEANPFPLWVLELTAANTKLIGIPNVKLLGNMHGNEAGGREILLHFIEYLIDQYDKEDNVTWLLKNTKIHVLPTLNPDGFADAANTCDGVMGREVPTNDVDLNRNFPDYFHYDPDLKQAKESIAIVKWMNDTKFILSAALHEGAMVANYPYDLNPNGNAMEFFTPDTDVFQHLAKTYSDNHPEMHKGIKCPNNKPSFEGGITNGAAWYQFTGGMGDYNYNFQGCMEVTLELSCCKYPSADTLPKLWNDNKKSLLLYCMQANRGVTATVLDYTTREPIEAKLKIIGRDKLLVRGKDLEIYFQSSKKTGQFWRLLLPGNYRLQVEAPGYYTEYKNFTVKRYERFPKLTKMTVLLTNTSISTSTTTSTTRKPTKTVIVPKLTVRFGRDESDSTERYQVGGVGELKMGLANCNNFNIIVLVTVGVLLVLLNF